MQVGEFGLGKSKTYEMLRTFAKDFNNLQVVAISGRNPKMKRSFEYLVEQEQKQDSIKVLDYTTKVPELMSVSDLVVTKPGGLTTSESLASRITYHCNKSNSWSRRRKCYFFRK